MLIWLEGNPTPQDLRDRMRASPGFQGKMLQWLESIISCELPSTTEPVIENDGPLLPPEMPPGWDDPRLHKKPDVQQMTTKNLKWRSGLQWNNWQSRLTGMCTKQPAGSI